MKFRKATLHDLDTIWQIILFAKESRRIEGSTQWQDGYPNLSTIRHDIEQNFGYVLSQNKQILFYTAIIFDVEPAYENIEGEWLSSHQQYAVVHRMAVAPEAKGKGLGLLMLQKIEELCLSKNIFSIKIDTNYDNAPMLHILDKLGYTYCGQVYFRGSARQAYEKFPLIPQHS